MKRRSSTLFFGLTLFVLSACSQAPPSEQSATPSFSPSIAASQSPKLQPESVAPKEPTPTNQSDELKEEESAPVSKGVVSKPTPDKASLKTSKTDTELPSEVVLTADDPKSKINLRAAPSVSGKQEGYGLVGDRVEVADKTTAEGYDWYKVRFPKSGAKGWIRGDFVSVDGTSQQLATTNSPNTDSSEPSDSEQTQDSNCDPSYPDVCIAPAPPDLDCRDISEQNFQAKAPDPHKLDRDKDGVGCES